jgi:hypothetical protein
VRLREVVTKVLIHPTIRTRTRHSRHAYHPTSDNNVTCLRHAAIVETQKSVNALRNSRGRGVFSVPCRAEQHRALLTTCRDDVTRHHARFQGNAVVNMLTSRKSTRCEPVARHHDMTWPDATELTGSVFRFAFSGYISEAVSSFSSVLRSEFAESVLGENFEVWRFYLKCVMKTMREWNIGV